MSICLACDANIRGTVYSFGTRSPLCTRCFDELEGLQQTAAIAAQNRAARAQRRQLGLLGKLLGLFRR